MNTPNRVTLPALSSTRRRAQRCLDSIPVDSGMIIVDARGLIEVTPTFLEELIRQIFVVLHSTSAIFVGFSDIAKAEVRNRAGEFKEKIYFDIDWKDL